MTKPELRMSNHNRKLKIAVLINAFWNSGAGISGGDQRVLQIFKHIDQDFQVDIYTSLDGKKVISKEIKSANFFISPQKFENGNILLRYRRRSNWLITEIKKRKYDIIYSSSDFFPDVLPAYHYKKNNPTVKWIACIFHIYPNWRKRPGNKLVNLIGSKIQNFSFARIRELADKIVNINYQVREDLTNKYNFNKKKIVINPCGIDIDYFSKIKVDKIKSQVCFLARLVPSKGIFDLPEIWQQVIEKKPEARLKIIGGGSNEIKLKLKTMFTEKGVDKTVEILGFLENDQAYKILKASEIFILPSHEEGFGIVIAEAFACSTPVVAWDLAVYKEVFQKTVLVANLWNKNDFSRKVIAFIENQSMRKKFALSAKNVIQRYSWEGIAEKEMNIIKS